MFRVIRHAIASLAVLCGALLFAPASWSAAPAGQWWNTAYIHRQQINIPNTSTLLASPYAVSFVLNHAGEVTAGRSLASGNDVRVVRWNGVGWTELNRVADLTTAWNTAGTRIWFSIAAPIPAASTDTDYYVYYGNAAAGIPPQNADAIFLLFDAFTGTTLNATKWTSTGPLSVTAGALVMSPSSRVQSTASFGVNTIWESRIAMADSLPGGGTRFYYYWMASNSVTYTGNHAGFYANVSANYASNRAAAVTQTVVSAPAPAVYRTYGFAREDTTQVRYWINGAQVSLATTNIPTTALPLLLYNNANGSRTQSYDWVRVRQYRNPDPLLTLAVRETYTAIDHFTIGHDRYGINCVAESITVSPRDSLNTPLTTYTQQITLNTQTGRGTWSLLTGAGAFADAVANDGLATYTWPSGQSSATFSLVYTDGTPTFDIDAYQTSNSLLRDDDTENTITFSQNGFTVTSVVLSNPPPNPIPAFVSPQTAGADFAIHIAAYGQTPTDPACGAIEAYAGTKSLKFWTTYANPTTGTRQLTINNIASAITEAAAIAQNVVFTNGQGVVTGKYKDVGLLAISMKDDTGVTVTRGGTGNVVFKPNNFALSQIRRSDTNVANPIAADAAGPAFMPAGAPFSVRITSLDAEGSATPNYGKELQPEGATLTTNLIAPAGGINPPLSAVIGFGAFNNGIADATDFVWPEVGIITLTPHVLDGSYLGAGDVSATTSANVGRFTPAYFGVAANSPSFQSGCDVGGYTYIGQPLIYAIAPVLSVTAYNALDDITQNYTGSFFKLATGTSTARAYSIPVPATLNQSGLPATTADPAVNELSGGLGALTFSAGTGLRIDRATPVAPFAAQISLSIEVRDSDNVLATANPITIANIDFTDGSAMQRYGRMAFRNAVGSELLNLPLTLQSEYFLSAAQGFTPNLTDSCTSGITLGFAGFGGNLASGETCVLDSGSPGSSGEGCAVPAPAGQQFATPPVLGNYNLVLRAPGSGNGGTVTVTAIAPSWLQFDWLASAPGNENPSGIATFGVFQGSPRRIYQSEK